MRALTPLFFAFCLIISSCKDSFKPEVSNRYKNLLVVDGFINVGGRTTIKVGRSVDLLDSRTLAPEQNATISVLGEDGMEIKGISNENGECFLATQSLSLAKKYKLKMVLADASIYETNFLSSKATPEIDELKFETTDKGFNVLLNTQDPLNDNRFYHWEFEEIWEVRVPFVSTHEYKNAEVVLRDPSINIQRCWANSKSSKILLASTERLSQDKLSAVPIAYVPGNSPKVAYQYSILVKQYGLTKEGYEYLENIKKNSENIGGIYDPQPSEVKGNLTCVTEPSQQVLGWISAGRVVEKRLFISANDKPAVGANWVYGEICDAKVIPKDSLAYYLGSNKTIVNEMKGSLSPGGPIIYRYTMSTEECIDCRLKGSNVKPLFWPN